MKVKGTPREKLAEAEFFVDKMREVDESELLSRPDFTYYLSAFLAAAATVIEIVKRRTTRG